MSFVRTASWVKLFGLLAVVSIGLTRGAGAQSNSPFVRPELMSVNSQGTGSGTGGTFGSLGSLNQVMSADGRFVVFESTATDLVTGITLASENNLYVRDRLRGITKLVNISSDGTSTGNMNADGNYSASISANGQFVVFQSPSTNLVTGVTDSNGGFDVFVRDLVNGTTTLISRANTGSPGPTTTGNENSTDPVISANGRIVVFKSKASNLVITPTKGTLVDLFEHDLQTQFTTMVSKNSSITGGANSDIVNKVDLSEDGQVITFSTAASNLVAGDTNNAEDVFAYNRVMLETKLLSLNSAGTASANGASTAPDISADGRYVAFESKATNIVAGITYQQIFFSNIYVRDLHTQNIWLVSRNVAATESGNGDSLDAQISANGEFVTYWSRANNLTNVSDTNLEYDVFRWNRQAQTTIPISVRATGEGFGNATSQSPQISADGRFVAFASAATNLVEGYTDPATSNSHVYLRDVQEGLNYLLSPNLTRTGGGNGNIYLPLSISASGRSVAFSSQASNIVSSDNNGKFDVFASAMKLQVPANAVSWWPPATDLNFQLTAEDVIGTNDGTMHTLGGSSSGRVGLAWEFNGVEEYINIPDSPTLDGMAQLTIEGYFKLNSLSQSTRFIVSKGDSGGEANPGTNITSSYSISYGNNLLKASVTVASGQKVQVATPFTDTSTYHHVALTYDGTTLRLWLDGQVVDSKAISGTIAVTNDIPFLVAARSSATGPASFMHGNVDELTLYHRALTATEISGIIEAGSSGKVLTQPAIPSTIQFSAPTYSISEAGGQATITVTRTGSTANSTSVAYVTSNGTATHGSDFTAFSDTLNFAPGEASKTFTVPIINDANPEGNETINLALSYLPNQTPGTPSTAVLTIVDDDAAGVLALDASTYSFAENGAFAVLNVVRSGGSSGTVTVNFGTGGGTAVPGTDYTAASGTLTFAPGETSKQIIVSITNDTVFKGNRTFGVGIVDATGGAVIGTANSAVVTIIEDDAQGTPGIIQFSATAYSVPENVLGGVINITISRTGGSLGPVTINFATSDGTAKAGTDYTPVAGSIPFQGGQTAAFVPVQITNDALAKGNRTVNLFLSTPTGGASLGTPATATLTIVEDDPVPPPVARGSFQFSSSSYRINEDIGLAPITVTRVGGSDGAVGVTVTFTGGNDALGSTPAIAGQHYLMPGVANLPLGSFVAGNAITLNFAHGETSKVFTIPIINDTLQGFGSSLTLTLSNPTGGTTVGSARTFVEISDNDAAPTLSISKVAKPLYTHPLPNTIFAGDVLEYVITYGSTGSTALNAVVQDTIPTGTTFVSAVGKLPNGSDIPAADITKPAVGGTGNVFWSVGHVPPGGTGRVEMRVKVRDNLALNTAINNSTYTLRSGTLSKSGTVVTTRVASPFSITKVAQVSPTNKTPLTRVAPGGLITYLITATNNSSNAATKVVVTDVIPSGAAYESATFVDAGGSAIAAPANPRLPSPLSGFNPRPVRFNPEMLELKVIGQGSKAIAWWFDLKAHETKRLQLTVRAAFDAEQGQEIVNAGYEMMRRTATAYERLATGVSRTVSISGNPTSAPQLGLSATATTPNNDSKDGIATATIGDVITYSFTAFNTGLSRVEEAKLIGAVPVGTTFVPGSLKVNARVLAQGDYILDRSGTLDLDLGDINPGGFVNVSYQAKATARANTYIRCEPYRIQTASLNQFTYGNAVSVWVATPVRFYFQKTASVDSLPSQSTESRVITYRIYCENMGGVTAKNVVVTDPIPAATSYANAEFEKFYDAQGDVIAPLRGSSVIPPTNNQTGKVTWNLGNMPSGHAVRMKLTVYVFATSGSVVNRAFLKSDEVRETPGKSVETRIVPPAGTRIGVDMDAPGFKPKGGSIITYTITVDNLGDAPALDTKLEVQLSPKVTFMKFTDAGSDTDIGATLSGSKVIFDLDNIAGKESAEKRKELKSKVRFLSVKVNSASYTGPVQCYAHVTATNADATYSPWVTTDIQPKENFQSTSRSTIDARDVNEKDFLGIGGFFVGAWNWTASAVTGAVSGVGNAVSSGWNRLVSALKGSEPKARVDALKKDLKLINPNSRSSATGRVDSFQLKNGVLWKQIGSNQYSVRGPKDSIRLIGLDGGTLVGNDGSTLIGLDGSTLVGNDGSTVVAIGPGHAIQIRNINFRSTTMTAQAISQNLSQLVAAGAGNMVAAGGMNMVAAGGLNLINNVTGDIGPRLPSSSSVGVIALSKNSSFAPGGGHVVGQNGASVVGQNGASVIGHNGGTLVGNDGASLVAAGAGNLQATSNGNSLIGNDGGSLIGNDGGS